MKATVLSDNNACGGLGGEWGLSVYIEHETSKILLDAGASGLFLKNAAALGVDLGDVDFAVLSHAHYDHATGMAVFFAVNDKANFCVRKGAAENCYFKKWLFRKYIGLPRGVLETYRDRIKFVSGDYTLYPGAYLIPHKTPDLQKIGERESMAVKTPGGWRPDDFSHEQSLVLETEKGLVIFNSCSHGGAANIVNEVRRTFPEKPVYGLIGGFHLYNKTEAEVRAFAAALNETGVHYVCTGHCTKEKAYGILQETLGDRLHRLHVGLEMTF